MDGRAPTPSGFQPSGQLPAELESQKRPRARRTFAGIRRRFGPRVRVEDRIAGDSLIDSDKTILQDETLVTDITIGTDGRIFVFGISRPVIELLADFQPRNARLETLLAHLQAPEHDLATSKKRDS